MNNQNMSDTYTCFSCTWRKGS